MKERERERKKKIFSDAIYKLNELSVGLNKHGHIRKLLNRNHVDEVPSEAAKCLTMKGPSNASN